MSKDWKKVNKSRLQRIKSYLNRRRPKFVRQESWRYVRVSSSWRKPRGIDNKMRVKLKGYPKLPSIGYRNPKLVRGLHPSGYDEALIYSPKDLEKIDPETQVVRIAHAVGFRKRLDILEKAKELDIKILNISKELLESTGEAKEKIEETEETTTESLLTEEEGESNSLEADKE